MATTSVSAPLSAGTATWSGTYEVARIYDISLAGGVLRGIRTTGTAAISLFPNFNNRTLVGGNSVLTAKGNFVGSDLTGSVTYRGLEGSLTGLVGVTGAVGAFRGDSVTDIYVGGSIVGRP